MHRFEGGGGARGGNARSELYFANFHSKQQRDLSFVLQVLMFCHLDSLSLWTADMDFVIWFPWLCLFLSFFYQIQTEWNCSHTKAAKSLNLGYYRSRKRKKRKKKLQKVCAFFFCFWFWNIVFWIMSLGADPFTRDICRLFRRSTPTKAPHYTVALISEIETRYVRRGSRAIEPLYLPLGQRPGLATARLA